MENSSSLKKKIKDNDFDNVFYDVNVNLILDGTFLHLQHCEWYAVTTSELPIIGEWGCSKRIQFYI